MRLSLGLLAALGLGTLLLSSTASAAPLSNYDLGHFAVDAGLTIPTSNSCGDYDLSKSNSAYFGVTAGIGNNLALAYRYDKYNGKRAKLNAHQINALYMLDPHFSVYVGYLRAKTDSDYRGDNSNGNIQGGIQGRANLPLGFSLWGDVSISRRSFNYDIGIGKGIIPNLDVNLVYYNHKYDDAIGGSEFRTRGLNLGLTFKM